MSKKSPNQKQFTPKPNAAPSSKPDNTSQFSYTHKVEKVVVRYHQGQPIGIVHPFHLIGLRSAVPTLVNKGGRPSVERTVRYVLNRALFDYLFIPRKTPPQPLTRYGLATLALKQCQQERDRIHALKQSLPKRKKELETLANDFIVSRDTFENFLKPFFTKPRQRLSPNALQVIFPHLWY